jgi:hypothetical protein
LKREEGVLELKRTVLNVMSDAALPGPDVTDRATWCEALTEGRRHEEAIPMDE